VSRDDLDSLGRTHTISVGVERADPSEQIAQLLQAGVEERKETYEKKEHSTQTVVHHQATSFVQQHRSGVIEQSFPYLFFWGRGGPSEQRSNRTSISSQLEYYARLSTRTFQGYDWVLHAYNFKARQQMVQQAFISGNVRLKDERRAAAWGGMSEGELQAAIKYQRDTARAVRAGKQRPDPPSSLSAQAMEFIKTLNYCLGEAEHTKENVDMNRSKIFSYMYRFGTPQLW
jgi:hypothetical protein